MSSQHPEARKLISQGVFDSIKSFKDFEGRVTRLIEINTTLGGNAFEIFVEAYLINQPKMQCAEVFVVKQLPLDITKELNLPNDGKGVDGVYKSFSEISVPYQVKFRSNRPPLSLTEVSTFLGLTERAKDRVLITNCDEVARDVKNRDYLRSIRGQDFDLLEEGDFELIEAWLKEKPVKRELPKPKPYQLIALEDIKKALGTHDRATAVMACGTGKTLIALWAAEQAEANTVLVLLPSLTLMQQTLLEWSKNNSWGNRFSFICVCSDPTVKANDEIEIDPTDIDFKVDTDPELVKEFLNQSNGKVKVVFSTYQSSKIVGEAVKERSPFDFAVFDEAHKTTGPKGGVFAYALDDQNISIKKRLFLTATPRHYQIKHRNKDGEFKSISMDDQSIYGPRAHSLTFGSAASQGIICNYKVIISLIDKTQIDDFALKNGITLVENDKIGARWVAAQIALRQAIEKVNALKIITFHSKIKSAKEFASETSHGIKRYLKDFNVMHVNGEQKSSERTSLIKLFKESVKSLITNARCLTEGIDVPAVDMVAFIDARHSRVDITQAIGRAMRKPQGSNKEFGYILVPIFADTSDFKNLDHTINEEGYDDIAEVINALQEQDESLVDIISELQILKGQNEIFNPRKLREKIEIINPYIDINSISNNIYSAITSSLGSKWDYSFGALKKFADEYGHCNTNQGTSYENMNLSSWITTQRTMYNKSILSKYRIDKLESLKNWSWSPTDDSWDNSIKALEDFIQEYDHIRINQQPIYKGIGLRGWVAAQRSLYKKNKLSGEKMSRLEALKYWTWNPFEEAWNSGYENAQDYSKNIGSLESLKKDCIYKDYRLGQWVNSQRASYKKSILHDEQIKKLELIPGWVWNTRNHAWEKGFNYLIDYLDEFKELPENKTIYKGYKLGSWTASQRQGKDNLSDSQIQKLENIPIWSWNLRALWWDLTIQMLRDYYDQNGHFNIRAVDEYKGFKLGNYVNKLRTSYNKNELSREEIEIVEKFPGWSWSPFKDRFNNNLNLLREFIDEYQTSRVSQKFIYKGCKLGSWVAGIRDDYKKNKLTNEEVNLFESLLKWSWDPYNDMWEEGFRYLKEYYKEHNNINFTAAYIYNGFTLGSWRNTQRVLYKRNELTESRIKKLEELDYWAWSVGKMKK